MHLFHLYYVGHKQLGITGVFFQLTLIYNSLERHTGLKYYWNI